MDATVDYCKVRQLGFTSMPTHADKDAVVTAQASHMQQAPAGTSSKCSSKESYKVHKSRGTCHCACKGNRRNRSNKSSTSDSIVSMSDTNSGKKAQSNFCVARLSLSNLNPISRPEDINTEVIRKALHPRPSAPKTAVSEKAWTSNHIALLIPAI